MNLGYWIEQVVMMMMMNSGVRVHDVGFAQFDAELQCESLINGGKRDLVSLGGLGNETGRVSLRQMMIDHEVMSVVFIQIEMSRTQEGMIVRISQD